MSVEKMSEISVGARFGPRPPLSNHEPVQETFLIRI